MSIVGQNLTPAAATLLPDDPEVTADLDRGVHPSDVAARHPASSTAWAQLAEVAWLEGRHLDSYAYARVGYHRGLDALRKAGWRGAGPIPWSHQANRGFLRCLFYLARAAEAIGEDAEVTRVRAFLDDSDPGVAALLGTED